MSVVGMERSTTAPVHVYDHAINLVDSTKSKATNEAIAEDQAGFASVPEPSTGQPVTRQLTGGHLRKELARRKYAKWQEEKEAGDPIAEARAEYDGDASNVKKLSNQDTAHSGRLRDKIPFHKKKKPRRRLPEQQTFIDALYENQRGWWFCGIPLYSSNSLLHIDPAGWQTSTFHDSPINITNAQVPDPSWQWVWQTWYVDMSYDVDEDGWQYSFSFGKQFAWHGNHPWFHSFVRRRRWLRRRVKEGLQRAPKLDGNMKDAHRLNPDYFTIHPSTRDRSRASSTDRATAHRSSFTDTYNTASETDDDMQDIGDIATLLAALKKSIVDREKIAAVKTFLGCGGHELYYLAHAMPKIMEDFVHQSSRGQLQQALLQALDEAIKADKDNTDDVEKQRFKKGRVDNLLKAIKTAGVHEHDVEYWNDLRILAVSEESGPINLRRDFDANEPPDVKEGAPKAVNVGQNSEGTEVNIRRALG